MNATATATLLSFPSPKPGGKGGGGRGSLRHWRGLSAETVERLRAHLAVAVGVPALRDRALVLTLLETGLRASEAASIRICDLEFDAPRIRGIVLGKGSLVRPIVFGTVSSDALREYLQASAHVSGYVFETDRGTRGYPKFVWRVVARVSKAAGIVSHPHAYRHTAAQNLLEKSGDVDLVSRVLGHGAIETTRRAYLDRSSAALLRRLDKVPE